MTEEVANEGGNVEAVLLYCVGEKDNIVHSITIFLTLFKHDFEKLAHFLNFYYQKFRLLLWEIGKAQ